MLSSLLAYRMAVDEEDPAVDLLENASIAVTFRAHMSLCSFQSLYRESLLVV